MRWKYGVIVVAVAVAIAIWFYRRDDRATTEPTEHDRAAAHTGSATGSARAPNDRAEQVLPALLITHGATKKIAGRVTLDGKPVVDAIVVVQNAATRAGRGTIIQQRSDADGRFDFGVKPPSWYDVTATAPGLTAAIAHVDLADPLAKPASDALELRLRDCTVFVEGNVFDASNNPLPKARVRREGLVGVETDATGAYKLCVPFGDHEIEYSADGYGAVAIATSARGEMHRDVVLVPEASVAVRVIRDDTKAPVPEAIVSVFPKVWGPEHPAKISGLTDDQGQVRIAGLVPGRYMVGAWSADLFAASPQEALALVGVAGPEVIVRMEATARIEGKVVMVGTTNPAIGARVMAVRVSPLQRVGPSITQPDGTFVVERAPAGDLAFTAAPFEVVTGARLETKAGTKYDKVVIEVRGMGAIRGRVTRLGKPVEGADVWGVRTPQTMGPTLSDADGRYEILGVPAGTYEIGAGTDAIGAFKLPIKVTLAAGEDKTVDLELDQSGTIAGVVVDKDGKPVKGVYVRWLHQKTGDEGRSITDAQGRYRCGAMTGGGTYRAAVFPSAARATAYPTADGAPYPERDVKDGSTVIEGVTIAIDRPQLAITGRVVDDTGAPVADAIVRALATSGGAPMFDPWLRLPMTSTTADGEFAIRDLAPGTYALQARAVDGSEGIAPAIAAPATNATIRIERAGSIEGSLVGYTQPPTVYARPATSFDLAAGTVDGTTFRIAGLRAGRYLVNAQTTYEGDAQAVEVRSGAATKVTLTSHGRAAIDGTVLDFKTRTPLANTSCHVVMSVDGQQTLTNWDLSTAPRSDERGHIVFDPAPAGTVAVTCDSPSFRRSGPSAEVTVAAGGRATVELLSVENTQENGGMIGATFDWRSITPRIMAVAPAGPAAKAGILAGDVVTDVNGLAVRGLNAPGVQYLILGTPIGEDVKLGVVRGGAVAKTFSVKVVTD